jgi:hemerythrin
MDYIKWTDDLSVGVELFDNEHKDLVRLVNDLNQLIFVGDKVSAMEKALAGLIEYTKTHFADEEKYMVKYNYPDYQKHKDEHEKLTAKVLDFQKRLTEGKANFSIELINFLRDWLIHHIQGSDMHYKAFFNGKGVK